MIIDDLANLEKQSVHRGIPILGHEKGYWLHQKVRELQPKKILELGTANGYSGCILGSTGAELTTIEFDGKIAEEAKRNFKQFKINAKIIIGDAVEAVKKMAEQRQELFDLVFIDLSKKAYNLVLDDCITLVKKQGLIIADNISFEGCQDYKQRVLNHPQLKTEIIFIRDGLSCSTKIK